MAPQQPSLTPAQAQQLMSQLIDGEIAPSDAARLKEYLENKPEEMAWMESIDATRDSRDPHADQALDREAIDEIRHAITLASGGPLRKSGPRSSGALIAFPGLLRALAAAAAIAFFGSLLWNLRDDAPETLELAAQPQAAPIVEYVETDIPDASIIVNSDQETGWTVVWVETFQSLNETRG